jgi:uncharacterized damage-inducible protein DinB
LAPDSCLSISTAQEFLAGVPQTVFESADLAIPWGRSYHVSADGRRFLIALTNAMWEQCASQNHASLTKLSSEDFKTIVDFYGRPMSLGDALWLELLDHIHHRGQSSVYLRVAGAKVPSIYGPTADVQWPTPD